MGWVFPFCFNFGLNRGLTHIQTENRLTCNKNKNFQKNNKKNLHHSIEIKNVGVQIEVL